MVVRACPDAPGIDLLVDYTKVFTYPNNTGCLSVSSGTQNIKVIAAGTSTTVIWINLDPDGDFTTFFANNTLAAIEGLVLEYDLSDSADDKTHVRFVHLFPDAPAVGIAVQEGAVLFSNRSLKSAIDFTPVPALTRWKCVPSVPLPPYSPYRL